MLPTGITEEAFISLVEVKLKINYTEEQISLIKAFGESPVFCFADPGTGKTFTAIGGLTYAELFKQIPGRNIYALSFTRLATGELAVRHEMACRKLRCANLVNFDTLHALCRSILKENYSKLGMRKFDTTGALTLETAYQVIEGYCLDNSIPIDPKKIKSVVRACESLNSALIFDEDMVTSKMAFKECGIEYDLFETLRGVLFSYALLTDTISVSDLLLYTVMLLTRFPEVSADFKSKCKLMLVDEAQDLSLLQLRIISLLTDNPVLIGDMKQQIYGFNGACQEVVDEFKKLYPNCTTKKLTQSFRCKDEIADFATRIILPNKIGGEDFKGVGKGGSVEIYEGLYEEGANINSITKELKREFVLNRNRFEREYMFLARNNISLIPVVEELFQQELPFRANNYTPVYDVPVIKELCELLQLADNPSVFNNALALRYVIPELRGYSLLENPVYRVCKKTGCDVFSVNYQFKNAKIAADALEALVDIHEMIRKGESVGSLFNRIWSIYNENWVKPNSWRLDSNPEYFIQSVNVLTRKNYSSFIGDEVKKVNIIKESERYGRGVRCYTMHASKGLEADVVYIIDANEGIIPNQSKLKKMLTRQCSMDAARVVREERALCYVACTRAKEKLYIVCDGKPAPIIVGENTFEFLDQTYEMYRPNGDDIRAFERFTDRYIPM